MRIVQHELPCKVVGPRGIEEMVMKFVTLLAIAFLQLTIAASASVGESGFTATTAAATDIAQEPVLVLAEAAPAGDGKMMDVNVTMNSPAHSRAWYSQPIWIAIFVLGGVVVLTLLVMALRGSGGAATVVKT